MPNQQISRTVERKLVAQFLYSLEYVNCASVNEVEECFIEYLAKEKKGRVYNPEDFSWQLIVGVWGKQKKIDETIKAFAQHWKIERIGKIELIALRIALYEIMYTPQIPKNVVLKEALDIVKAFGDTQANPFIVGIIEQVAKDSS